MANLLCKLKHDTLSDARSESVFVICHDRGLHFFPPLHMKKSVQQGIHSVPLKARMSKNLVIQCTYNWRLSQNYICYQLWISASPQKHKKREYNTMFKMGDSQNTGVLQACSHTTYCHLTTCSLTWHWTNTEHVKTAGLKKPHILMAPWVTTNCVNSLCLQCSFNGEWVVRGGVGEDYGKENPYWL